MTDQPGPPRGRGRCPDCGVIYALTKAGRLRVHPIRGSRIGCAGSGKAPDFTEAPGTAAQAFSAREAIMAGLWDRHLRLLAGAIKVRQRQIDDLTEGTDHA